MGILLLLCSCLFPCADTPGRGARGWGMHGTAVKPGHSSVRGERRQTFSIPVCFTRSSSVSSIGLVVIADSEVT